MRLCLFLSWFVSLLFFFFSFFWLLVVCCFGTETCKAGIYCGRVVRYPCYHYTMDHTPGVWCLVCTGTGTVVRECLAFFFGWLGTGHAGAGRLTLDSMLDNFFCHHQVLLVYRRNTIGAGDDVGFLPNDRHINQEDILLHESPFFFSIPETTFYQVQLPGTISITQFYYRYSRRCGMDVPPVVGKTGFSRPLPVVEGKRGYTERGTGRFLLHYHRYSTSVPLVGSLARHFEYGSGSVCSLRFHSY